MARPYSLDLRDRAVAAVAAGRSCRSVAAMFGVSVAAVVKWSQRYRATGSAAAKKMGGQRRGVLASEREWLLARLRAEPDLTMRGLAKELADRGIVVSHVSVWNLLRRERQQLKKSNRGRRAAPVHRAST
jgi:transposase